jgi:2-methylcitrate dehydratase PrpD
MNHIIQKAPVLHYFVRLLRNKKIDEQSIHQAKRVVADSIGVAYSGVQTETFQLALKAKNDLFGKGDFKIWGTTESLDLPGSVFYNSLSSSSTDFDEGHRKAVGHPASLVVPVAMQLGQFLNKTYSEILTAIIVGYEAGTRFSNARFPEKVETYSTGRWGAIASAATASVLLDLDEEQFMHSLSLAFVSSPGMQGGSTDVSTGSMLKEGVAWAAQMGLQSALLAKKGVTGPFLFIDAYDEIDSDKLVGRENNEWLINSNYFKPFACCRWLHTAINLLLEIKKENDLTDENIEKIEVKIFRRAIDLIGSKYPNNVVQSQFHLPFVLVCALLFDKVTPMEITPENLKNSKLLKLIDKTALMPDDEFTKSFPGELGSKVSVTTTEGNVFQKMARTAPWDADNPPSDEELFSKFKLQTGHEADTLWKSLFATR